ncbi:MAG: hypothetical protein ABL874_01345 [Sphingopyxis sp.]
MAMAEPKPFASLSAGLLASKGGARPAMRRQAQLPTEHHNGHDDLGWNDMGYDADPQDQDSAHDVGLAATRGLSPMAPSLQDKLCAAIESANAQSPEGDAAHGDALAVPEVHLQQQALEQALSPAVPVAAAPAPAPILAPAPDASETVVAMPEMHARAVRKSTAPRARAGSRGNFAFTLRLDPERHLRLRLASAAHNQSTQQILVALVDDYLADQPEITAFAAQLPASKRTAHL